MSTVSRVISEFDTELESPSDTPFLDNADLCNPIAYFEHDELVLGKQLDYGRFTESFEIKRINRNFRFKASSMMEEKARLDLFDSVSTKGQRNYCVKRLKTDVDSEHEVERAILGLVIEANYLARLDHPNIIKLRGLSASAASVENGSYVFYNAIITNRITESLAERIDYWNEQGKISLESDFILHLKTDYAFQIADAVSYLHDRRIIFRNLSLNNIGFTSNDTIQLMNFDCVKEVPEGATHLEDGFKCSQTYMPLEMYQECEYDYKVDSFSWAICFYEMLTQEPAFETTSNGEALIREQGWCPSLNGCSHFVPDGLLDLLEDAWEPIPEDRTSIKEIKKQLEWILFGGDDDDDGDDCQTDVEDVECGVSQSNPFSFADESALGLDIDESSSCVCRRDSAHVRRSSQAGLEAAIYFSGTKNSFIPEHLLLSDETEPAPQITPEAATAIEHIIPKLEYTMQYKGIKKENLPPPLIPMKNDKIKARRRCSNRFNPSTAMCA